VGAGDRFRSKEPSKGAGHQDREKAFEQVRPGGACDSLFSAERCVSQSTLLVRIHRYLSQ
jgi:hypothetical protein